MSEYQIHFSDILKKLKNTRNRETWMLLGTGTANALSVLSILLISASMIELVARGDVTFRGIVAALILGGLLVAGWYYIFPYLLRATGLKYLPSEEKIALRVGEVYPEIKDKLCNSIQLVSHRDKFEGTSQNLAYAAFENIYNSTKAKDFDKIINKKKIKKSLIMFFATQLITILIFLLFSSSLGASLYRLVNWHKSFLPPAPYTLSIEPKSRNVLRGESVKISIKATGKFPESLQLYIKEKQQEKFDVYNLKSDNNGNYIYEITSVKSTFIFYAESQWLNTSIKTDECVITVTDKPLVKSIAGRIAYPGYTALAPKSFDEQNADITALKGSSVDFQIISNKDLKSAKLVIESQPLSSNLDSLQGIIKLDTLEIPMKVNGRKAFGSMHVAKSGSYHFDLIDNENQTNNDPIKYNIISLVDEYPGISLDEPQMDVEISDNAMLPMKITITDDYGFSGLKLNYRLIESKFTQADEKFSSVNIPYSQNVISQQVNYLWNLNNVNISPEDKYEFYVEVFDNDRVSGPKSSKSKILTVRLPSLDEVLKSTDVSQDKIEKDIKKVLKQAEEVKKEVEQMDRDLMQKPKGSDLDWKEKKKAEDIMKKQAELQDKIADVQKSLEDMTQKLDENKALSPETMEKYMELQKLMQQVSAPELQKMQKMMEEAFKKMSPDELQKAMKNAKFDEEQFRKSIERTLKILKRLQAEQKTDALTKRAEELAKNQDELNKKMDNSNANDKKKRDELAEQQKDLKKEMNNIAEDLKDLEKLMKEIGGNMPMDELQKAKDELSQKETSEDMQESQESMEKGDFNKAGKSQKQASQKLKKFAEKMKSLKDKMNDNVKKEAIRKMQKAVNDMLELSKEQENLTKESQNTDYNSTKIPEMADKQQEIQDGLENVANSMMELSQKSFAVTPEMGMQMGQSLQQMSQAMQQLANRQTQAAAQAQMKSMAAMNMAAAQMQASVSAMQKPGNGSCDNPGGSGQGQGAGGGSFGQRLQQVAGQQQGVNSAMQQMGQGNNGKLSPEQQAELGKIAKAQGNAQKSLEDLANEQKKFGGDDRRTLGNLEQIAKDMKEVMTNMQSGNITPETLKRQEKILSRLLDASMSMNERDYEKKRESRVGKNVNRNSPGAIDMNTQEGKSRMLEDMLKSIQQGYTKDFELLIRKYFESLQTNGNSKSH